MLGALFIAPGEAALPNPWKPWLDHLLSQQGDYHVQRAALTYTDGKPAAASKDFVLSLAEVKVSSHICFACKHTNNMELLMYVL